MLVQWEKKINSLKWIGSQNQRGDISTLNGTSLKLVVKFTYLGSRVSWASNDRLLILWKSVLIDEIKRCFFLAAVVSILLYGCTTWTLAKCMEKNKNAACNIEQILEAAPQKQQLYSHLPPIAKTIQVRRTKHAEHCWRCRDELISDILQWTPSHGWAKAGRPARTYIQQLCADTGCSLEDLLEAMDDREGWWERAMEICAGGAWWWWRRFLFFFFRSIFFISK